MSGEINSSYGTFNLKKEREADGWEYTIIVESEGGGAEMQVPFAKRENANRVATTLWENKKKTEFQSDDALILYAEVWGRGESQSERFSTCEELSFLTEEELKETFKDNYLVSLGRVVFSEKSHEELSELYEKLEYPKDGAISTEAEENLALATKWAEAFVDRDGEALMEMAAGEVHDDFIGNGMTDEEFSYFGWSSPWPMFTKQLYEIDKAGLTARKAEITYYATDSTPHVWVWKEVLQFAESGGTLRVISEELHTYDLITSLNELILAYSEGIEGTMMDYTVNGLGEALNDNALREVSKQNELEDPGISVYQQLFSPETAAAELLNISMDEKLVSYAWEDTGETATVQIYFLRDDGSAELAEIIMWQPYGEDGIWIPKEISTIGSVTSVIP